MCSVWQRLAVTATEPAEPAPSPSSQAREPRLQPHLVVLIYGKYYCVRPVRHASHSPLRRGGIRQNRVQDLDQRRAPRRQSLQRHLRLLALHSGIVFDICR
jgi:hypothetical protein